MMSFQRTRRRRFFFPAAILLCLSAVFAEAQSGGGQQLTQSVIASGGGSSASGGTQVEGTVGQSVTDTSGGGSFTLEGGFWAGATAPAASTLAIDDATGTYGGKVTLKATLNAAGTLSGGKLISFSFNGMPAGTATTDTNGLATLTGVSVNGINAGTYPGAMTAQFAGDASVAAGSGTGRLTILKADPLLQVTGGTFTYDGQPHPASATATGVNNESLAPPALLYNGASQVPAGAGTYTVTATFAGNNNYNPASSTQQSIIINQAVQSISFGALPDKVYGDAAFTVGATTSSGLGVSFTATGQCTVTGNTVQITGAGSCTVTASQAGDSNYTAAANVSRRLAISKATAFLTLGDLSQTYDGAPKSAGVTTNPAGVAVTLTYDQNGTPVASPTGAGSYSVTATVNDQNYQGTATGMLIIDKAMPAITWNTPSDITYGTPLNAVQFNAAANVPGTFTYTPSAGTVLGVGSHQLSVTFTPADANNYTTASKSVQLTVGETMATEINLSAPAYSAGEDEGRVSVTVNRTGDTTGAASVDYTTGDTAGLQPCSSLVGGAASSRCDYATITGTLSFAPGEASKTISIPVVDDSYAEGPETFTFTLSNAVGESLGPVGMATITITDNEAMAGSNPITQVPFFVRQQYIDFLGREPDPVGYQGWQDILNRCAPGDVSCDRVLVSSGFFRSLEFQMRGYFIYKFYAASLGRKPSYAEFMPDMGRVSGFVTDAQLETNKTAFAQEFMSRPEFANRYGALDNAGYVSALLQAAGLPNHPLRGAWISDLDHNTATRTQVLKAFIESPEVSQKFYNEAFVVMQYFGYLRRDPDAAYLQWIQMLNQAGDYRAMISGFLNSNEYVQRFGP